MSDLEWTVLYYYKLHAKLEKIKRVQQPLEKLSIAQAIEQSHENIITLQMLRDFYAVETDSVETVVAVALADVNENIVNIKACIVQDFNVSS